jgi:transposase
MMYLGLDIGKRWHEAALVDADGDVVRQLRFAPTRTGLTELAEWLGALAPTAVQIGLEGDGDLLAHAACVVQQWGAPRARPVIRVLNPLQTRAFRNANMRGTKSDRVDCVAIARLLRWEGDAPRVAHACPTTAGPPRARSAASARR